MEFSDFSNSFSLFLCFASTFFHAPSSRLHHVSLTLSPISHLICVLMSYSTPIRHFIQYLWDHDQFKGHWHCSVALCAISLSFSRYFFLSAVHEMNTQRAIEIDIAEIYLFSASIRFEQIHSNSFSISVSDLRNIFFIQT